MKKIIILLFLSLSSVALMVSCDDMYDIQKKYADADEVIYLGMTDSLVAYSGVGKVKLVWYANADPKLETTMIYWNTREDSIVKPFIRRHAGVQKDSVIIEDLAEGAYIFELINMNKRGERSLTARVEGISYGENFAANLRIRYIRELSYIGFDPVQQSSTVKISWGEAPEGSIGSKVTYRNRSTGEEITVDVDATENETALENVGNRLGHPDDVLCISSVYMPAGMMDPVESPKKNIQAVCYTASGKRVEKTFLQNILPSNVSMDTTLTFTYVNQDKVLVNAGDNGLVFNCSRVADLSPLTPSTAFSLTINDDLTVSTAGYYATSLNLIEDEGSAYHPETQTLVLKYKVSHPGGSYTVEETLVPKTTPVEIEAAKPFGDARSDDRNDQMTSNASYRFEHLFDNIWWSHPNIGPNGLLTAAPLTSSQITLELQETMKLTRMVMHPNLRVNAADPIADLYANANLQEFELWGTTVLDTGKPASYWVNSANPAGTYKEDWEFLGIHTVENLTYRGWGVPEKTDRAIYGNHFTIPEAAPVKYIRLVGRKSVNAYLANPNYNPFAMYIGELSFFGYVQE